MTWKLETEVKAINNLAKLGEPRLGLVAIINGCKRGLGVFHVSCSLGTHARTLIDADRAKWNQIPLRKVDELQWGITIPLQNQQNPGSIEKEKNNSQNTQNPSSILRAILLVVVCTFFSSNFLFYNIDDIKAFLIAENYKSYGILAPLVMPYRFFPPKHSLMWMGYFRNFVSWTGFSYLSSLLLDKGFFFRLISWVSVFVVLGICSSSGSGIWFFIIIIIIILVISYFYLLSQRGLLCVWILWSRISLF